MVYITQSIYSLAIYMGLGYTGEHFRHSHILHCSSLLCSAEGEGDGERGKKKTKFGPQPGP